MDHPLQSTAVNRDTVKSVKRSTLAVFCALVMGFIGWCMLGLSWYGDSSGEARVIASLATQRARAWAMVESAETLTQRPLTKDEIKSLQATVDAFSKTDDELKSGSLYRYGLGSPSQEVEESMTRALDLTEMIRSNGTRLLARKQVDAKELRSIVKSFQQRCIDATERVVRRTGASGQRTAMLGLILIGGFVVTLLILNLWLFQPSLRRAELAVEQSSQLQDQLGKKNELLVERTRVLDDQRAEVEANRRELIIRNQELESNREKILAHEEELVKQNEELQEKQIELKHLVESYQKLKDLQAQAARRAEDLFTGVPVACFSFDIDGLLHQWNLAAEELYGYAAYEVLYQPMWVALNMPEAERSSREAIHEVFGKGKSFTSEWTYFDREGNEKHLLTTSFPIRDADGNVIAGIGATQDLTARKRYEQELLDANAKLSALAVTDGLTGLHNHRSFQDMLENEFIRSTATGTDLSLILLDVDHFKKLNDTYGHPAGDAVLKAVAQLLRDRCEQPFVPCRYGGEEFVVILPGADEVKACEIAEILRSGVESLHPEGLLVTASFGVATWYEDLRSRAEMIAQADKALYMSKHGGRNRATHASTFNHDPMPDHGNGSGEAAA
jgi:diguanylate cyclase (GGDEF)-like protein/PAS domain S-box-containing protein